LEAGSVLGVRMKTPAAGEVDGGGAGVARALALAKW
jgi:hypothetical protein